LTGPIGATGPTGATGPQGPAGTNGNNGTNGLNALIKTTTEPAGSNCSNGGTKIETGLDANGNGILDAAEINSSQTQYVCNGLNGTSNPGASPGSSAHGSQLFTIDGIFICPVNGTYNLIGWGANGGNGGNSAMGYGYFSGGNGGTGAMAEFQINLNIGDTIYFSIGNQGTNGSDCLVYNQAGFYCCGQRPNGTNGGSVKIGLSYNVLSNFDIEIVGGSGGGGSGISCGNNGYTGGAGSNGDTVFSASYLNSGFFLITNGLSQCKYSFCPGPGRLLIRW
jgi:hypothetical protein